MKDMEKLKHAKQAKPVKKELKSMTSKYLKVCRS